MWFFIVAAERKYLMQLSIEWLIFPYLSVDWNNLDLLTSHSGNPSSIWAESSSSATASSAAASARRSLSISSCRNLTDCLISLRRVSSNLYVYQSGLESALWSKQDTDSRSLSAIPRSQSGILSRLVGTAHGEGIFSSLFSCQRETYINRVPNLLRFYHEPWGFLSFDFQFISAVSAYDRPLYQSKDVLDLMRGGFWNDFPLISHYVLRDISDLGAERRISTWFIFYMKLSNAFPSICTGFGTDQF